MLKPWVEILPMFIVKRVALLKCERVRIGHHLFVTVRPGIYIQIED